MKNCLRFIAILGVCLVLAGIAVPTYARAAIAAASGGVQQFAELGDFKLQSGAMIHDFKLGYRTLGTLNSEKSNAIFWPTWLGGRTENLLEFVGPGRVLDSGKYFVILVDAIGAPVMTLDSVCGHASFRCISVGPLVAQFLADPGTVRSTTLRDSSKH